MTSQGDQFSEAKQQKVTTGSWAYMVCKLGLKSIDNPAGVKVPIVLKKGGDHGGKYVSDETMSQLVRAGIVDEIFIHYVNLTKKDKVRGAEKN